MKFSMNDKVQYNGKSNGVIAAYPNGDGFYLVHFPKSGRTLRLSEARLTLAPVDLTAAATYFGSLLK